jgi:hypothetical protein
MGDSDNFTNESRINQLLLFQKDTEGAIGLTTGQEISNVAIHDAKRLENEAIP